MSSPDMNNRHSRSFWALIGTQFFGAFNDNIFQIVVALLVVNWITDPVAQNKWVTLSGVVFALPFLLFSLLAGRMADRWSKSRLIVTIKLADLFAVAIAIAGLYAQNVPLLMIALFLLALQSAFFAPAKYGILPEIKTESELSQANGFLNAASLVAILGGTIVGTFTAHDIHSIALIMGLLAGGSIVGSLLIEKLPAANPTQTLDWNPFPDFFRNWRLIQGNRPLRLSLLAVSYFWFVGGVLHLNMLVYVSSVMHLPDKISGVLLTAIVIGVASGSLLAGWMSRQKVELGLVPIGAIGTSVFTLDLFFSHGSLYRTLADSFFLGVSSGLYVIPLNTLIQLRSPKEERGRILATASFLSFVAILLAMMFLRVLGSVLHASPAHIFLVLGLLSLVATAAIYLYLPQAFVRLVIYFLTNTVYRLHVIGRENVPLQGPALLVPNHVSMVDSFLVAGSLSRMVRFLMFRDIYDKPFIHAFAKFMDVIPISENDSPKEMIKSLITARKRLEEGHVVCLFAEGQVSRLGGAMLGFKRGLEIVLKGLDVPVIPVHLEGVWGSIFSFKGGKFLGKWPQKLPYPVTVTFGKPMKNVTSAEIRQAVMDLGAEAFAIHRRKDPTLFETFLTQAKSFPNQKIVADSSGKELTYRQLLTAAALVGRKLESILKPLLPGEAPGEGGDEGPAVDVPCLPAGRPSPPPSRRQTSGDRARELSEHARGKGAVGILLPPSVAAAVANLAVSSQGWAPVNLNYTLSREAVDQICSQAKIKRVLTSAKMLEKLGGEKAANHLLIEDLLSVSTGEKIRAALLIRLLPAFLLRRTVFKDAPHRLEELATILFTSGSTGVPKGVMLTQENILSNVQSLTMILQMHSQDVFLGVLPFFHSFGFTATLWFPLLGGFKAVYHHNPLDSKTIGELGRKERVTFLMGTPTFLSAYIRRIPKEDFPALRFAVAGAEKLRPELAQAFEEKYGAPILEGYGCTELSPVVALNVPDIMDGEVLQVGRKVGKIGRPIPGVSARIVDPDTGTPVKPGQPGLLLIKGPNVMKGYLDDPGKTQEAMRDGWYVTGDIASLDDDGFLEITDRLSRFSKIGGEMVPHILVEQKLHEVAAALDRQFVVTSVSDDKKGEALVVLVSGFTGNLDQLWKDLNNTILPKLWIPARDKFFPIEAIPVLGSGKVDMPQAKRIAEEKTVADQ